jgi:hypothetical protein
MSHISPAGSFGSSNWLQGAGSTANSSASSGVNAGSGTSITEASFAIIDINVSGVPFSDGSPSSSSLTSSSPSSATGTSTPSTSNSGTSSSGSSLFANLLNQIDTALQSVLQAFEGNATGASTTTGGTGTASTGATDTGATGTGATGTGAIGTAATGTGSTSSSGPSNTTPFNTTPSNTTGGTSQTGSDSNTPATSGSTSDVIVAAISIESIEVTTGGASSDSTTGTDSNATGGTNSSSNPLQLLEQALSALSNVFQQNGIGSSQTSSASQSPLATFLGQNGLTPDQFSQGVFASLQQNGGTGFSLANIFQNAPTGQNLNLFA